MFDALLRFANFRIFFITRALSLIGEFAQRLAAGWLAYELTDSGLILGITVVSRQIAIGVLSPVAGVWIDRLNRRKVIFVTQSLFMLQAFALAIATYTGHISVEGLIALELFAGIVSGLDMPLRHTFLYDLITDKRYLTNGIALQSSMFNTCKIIGPAFAGFMIPFIGEAGCFFFNGVTFVFCLAGLWMMKLPPIVSEGPSKVKFLGEFVEGLRYAWQTPRLRASLLLASGMAFFCFSYGLYLPIYTGDYLNKGTEILGLLTTGIAAGAILGALLLARHRNKHTLINWVIAGCVLYGVSNFLFASWVNFFFAMVCMLLLGLCEVWVFATTKTIVQSTADPAFTGRISSIYVALFMIPFTLGAFLKGWMIDQFGLMPTLVINGIGCLGVLGVYVIVNRSEFYYLRNEKKLRRTG
ncbi:MAG: MFS transporter [Bacteroidota bacterium]